MYSETDSRSPKAAQISDTLKQFISQSSSRGSAKAAAVMTREGMMMGAALDKDTNEDIFAAMNASLLMLAQKATDEMSIGDFRQMVVLGSAGIMHLTELGDGVVLAVATGAGSNLGRVMLDTRQISVRLRSCLDSPTSVQYAS
ncbi:roadblock/LC7 domain-containing protein [Oceanobacter sp. 4_MG-2023]|uniref:roadblock/LC7 domain-containing protein n=1 Tax=Oceanobacter sp. 4_MG-2023 TaxID=3062623 RepID=UPI0027363415|nr:roadblock/LC7 domain-containing protein [Oceanobacter sp. 4_MG-2023]MDP2548855.1 roadblock/LC7 domain-containing protein [Oceanobacter sp. 4_MG-2023]